MQIAVKLFGHEARLLGAREVTVDVPGPLSAADLRRRVADLHPAHRAAIESCRVAINHDFAADGAVVKPGDEAALIGSVSGG